jgi:uncharacterized protein YdeI (YjbR/CyaY-like superfamily)
MLVNYTIQKDPLPLGVEVPEVLIVYLNQDSDALAIYDKLSDGRKRTLIHRVLRTKDIDKQINLIGDFLVAEAMKKIK